jgi:hypothetical protein
MLFCMRKIRLLLLLTLFFSVVFVSCKKTSSEIPTDNTNIAPNSSPIEVVTSLPVATQMPTGLPRHISFGTEGDVSVSSKYIKEADYQYQYLAGDIFSNGWTTWNYPSGEFARTFLKNTGEMGKIPVFSYYNIVPAKNRFEDPGFTNLHDAEVMNKYFDDWKFLLQICKSYGKTVIIQYEPDLFGYLQMFKSDSYKSFVNVSGSNNPEVKAFANNAKGLAQAIVSMRNKYAPNVILGWHASQWATGFDVIKDKHNPEQIAAATATYYKSLNASFDIIFSEFCDRDAGYNQVINNKQNAMWSTEPNSSNGYLSDYDRFQRYLKKLNQDTGQKIILWQIPIGNTLTETCNNTRGHFKDNRAEYFLQPVIKNGDMTKIRQYGDAGVIAFLFGRGATDCTSFMDSKGDGVTATNETADDDGGYLRKAVKAYYLKSPVAIP